MTPLETRPLESTDRVWATKARDEEVAALSNLRGTAEKWAGALTTALGVVSLAALLQGPKVFSPLTKGSRDAAKVAFFLAGLAALIAIVMATLAAQQSRERILGRSGTQYKDWSNAQVKRWAFWLSVSRWLAALAAAAVLVSAFLLWFGERATARPTVIDGRGSALCVWRRTRAAGGDGVRLRDPLLAVGLPGRAGHRCRHARACTQALPSRPNGVRKRSVRPEPALAAPWVEHRHEVLEELTRSWLPPAKRSRSRTRPASTRRAGCTPRSRAASPQPCARRRTVSYRLTGIRLPLPQRGATLVE